MAANSTETVDTTNYEKFQTGNPVVKRLIGGFYDTVEEVVKPLKPATVLDAGCGEGETLDRLSEVLPPAPTGIDLNPESVEFAARRLPGATIRQADLLNLPFEDGSFDLVFCLEVLEHLHEPRQAIRELARVSKRAVIVSVPHEPWFSTMNAARGKNHDQRPRGSDPDHRNLWTRKAFEAFIGKELEIVWLGGSLPWTICVARKR